MYDELITSLDGMLSELGNEVDQRFETISDDEIRQSVKASEDNLEVEFHKIDQIRAESLNAAMQDYMVYI